MTLLACKAGVTGQCNGAGLGWAPSSRQDQGSSERNGVQQGGQDRDSGERTARRGEDRTRTAAGEWHTARWAGHGHR